MNPIAESYCIWVLIPQHCRTCYIGTGPADGWTEYAV